MLNKLKTLKEHQGFMKYFNSHGLKMPLFEEFQHGFRVTIYKEKLDEGIKSLYEYIKQNPSKRVSEIERWMKQLRVDGKVEFSCNALTPMVGTTIAQAISIAISPI